MEPLHRFGLSLAIAVLAAAAPAASRAQSSTADKLVLRGQQSSPLRGIEQMALVFEPRVVTLRRNSNFLEEAAAQVQLGVFTVDAKRFASDRARIQAIVDAEAAREPVKSDVQAPRSSEALRVFAGTTEMSPESEAGKAILELFRKAGAYSGWKSLDSVTIKAESASDIQLQRRRADGAVWVPFDPADCTQQAPRVLVCKVPSYGWAYLRPKK